MGEASLDVEDCGRSFDGFKVGRTQTEVGEGKAVTLTERKAGRLGRALVQR